MVRSLLRRGATVALISLLTTLFAACGSPAAQTPVATAVPATAAAPTEAVVPTEAPAPTEAATEAPATVEVTAEATAAAATTEATAVAATAEATAEATATEATATEVAATTATTEGAGEVKGVAPKGDGNLTLWVAGNSPDIQQAFDQVAKTFMDNNPGFKVTVQYIPWGELSTKLTTAFAGNVGPDIFMHGVAASAGFMSKDQIEDLKPYFDQLADKDDLLPNLIQAGTVDGKLAMVPVQVTNYMLLYRKDLYQEVGLDPNKPPTTWQELIDNSKKLTQSDDAGITRAGLQVPSDDNANVEQQFAPMLWTEGGQLVSDDGKKAAFNSDAGKTALKHYVDLFHTDKVASLTDLPGDPSASTIGRGAAAQMISGQFELASVKKTDEKVYEQIGVALPPVGASGKPYSLSSFSGFMMNKNAKNKDDAWTLMRHIISPSSLTTIDSTSLFLPPRTSLLSAEWVTSDPLFQVFADNLKYGQGNPNIPQWVEVRNALGENLIAALNQKMTPDEALATAEQRVNEILSK